MLKSMEHIWLSLEYVRDRKNLIFCWPFTCDWNIAKCFRIIECKKRKSHFHYVSSAKDKTLVKNDIKTALSHNYIFFLVLKTFNIHSLSNYISIKLENKSCLVTKYMMLRWNEKAINDCVWCDTLWSTFTKIFNLDIINPLNLTSRL